MTMAQNDQWPMFNHVIPFQRPLLCPPQPFLSIAELPSVFHSKDENKPRHFPLKVNFGEKGFLLQFRALAPFLTLHVFFGLGIKLAAS